MKTELWQKIEFFLTLLEDRLEGEHPEKIQSLLKEMKALAQEIKGPVLEHFLELEREAYRYLKKPTTLSALKERVLKLRNEFWEL